jgi:hypothetical protein
MKYAPKYAMQAGGEMRQWSNPQRTFHHSLVKLSFDCEADPYPGVLILANQSYTNASAMSVKDLRKELEKILESLGDDTIAYWQIVRDDTERDRLLAGLTATPIFDDILG